MISKPVMHDATVLLLEDQEIGGQAMLAISKEGALFLSSPGNGQSAIFLELPKLKIYFEQNEHRMGGETARVGLEAIAKYEREAS